MTPCLEVDKEIEKSVSEHTRGIISVIDKFEDLEYIAENTGKWKLC